jgi:hypothetical protein
METFATPEGEPSANAVDCLNVHRWAERFLSSNVRQTACPISPYLMRCGLRDRRSGHRRSGAERPTRVRPDAVVLREVEKVRAAGTRIDAVNGAMVLRQPPWSDYY